MHFQPFIPFEKKYLNKLISNKQYYWVSQSYQRGSSAVTGSRIPILITSYDDKELAQIHKNAVKNDLYAALINIQNEAHYNTLLSMLMPESKYFVYWGVVHDYKQLEKYLNDHFGQHIKRYIDKKTNWRINGNGIFRPAFQLTFGELYITLKWSGQSVRVKFEEIENV